ncbi:hypothetical protein PENTCL1PPCAC_12507, partial [Pristionchus entomophagus]
IVLIAFALVPSISSRWNEQERLHWDSKMIFSSYKFLDAERLVQVSVKMLSNSVHMESQSGLR